jgi:hypothetical protein
MRLSQRGVREQDIVDIAELLKDDAGLSSKGSIRIEEIRSLIAELRTYGSIKSTIMRLSQKVDKLKNEVDSLRAEKQNLNAQNQRIFSTLQHSKHIASFFSGTSMSLRNEIIDLVSIMACTIYLLNMQVESLQKSQGSGSHPLDSEFMPLATAARGEAVDLGKLKIAVTKSIEVMLERLNENSKLKEILANGRLALLNEQL